MMMMMMMALMMVMMMALMMVIMITIEMKAITMLLRKPTPTTTRYRQCCPHPHDPDHPYHHPNADQMIMMNIRRLRR